MAIVLLARGKRARDPTEQQAGHPRSVAEEAKRMQGARTTPARVGARVERRAFFSSTPRDSENRLPGRPDGEQGRSALHGLLPGFPPTHPGPPSRDVRSLAELRRGRRKRQILYVGHETEVGDGEAFAGQKRLARKGLVHGRIGQIEAGSGRVQYLRRLLAFEHVLIDELHGVAGKVRSLDADPLLHERSRVRVFGRQWATGLAVDVARHRS